MAESSALVTLRGLAGDILMSSPCQQIDFHWGRNHIDGSGFSFVALALLTRHASRGLHFKIEHQPPGVGASYFALTNTFSVPNANYGAKPGEKIAIVHEAAHAIGDATKRKG